MNFNSDYSDGGGGGGCGGGNGVGVGGGRGYSAENFEDKKCRICGFADKENLNIFKAGLEKVITSVFPIILYENDPLPKNICKKCLSNAVNSYHDIQKVSKLHNKWIENVKTIQPSNSYIQVINTIKNANEAIKNLIKKAFHENLPSETINCLLISSLSEVAKAASGVVFIDRSVKTESIEKSKQTEENFPINVKSENKSKTNDDIDDDDEDSNDSPIDEVEDDEDMALSKIAHSKKSSVSSSPTIPSTTTTTTATLEEPSPPELPSTMSEWKCSYCFLQFETSEKLALHQLSHLKLKLHKLFKNKYLDKNSRRGRLIMIRGRQHIRCLSCWHTFDDNKSILEHWSKAECDFYCGICGKEYPQAPKMMREHLVGAHGISYKSLKIQKKRFNKINRTSNSSAAKQARQETNNKKTNVARIPTEEPPSLISPIPKNPSEKFVKCRVCLRDFHNFQACNSHMKVHKPPYTYTETAPLPPMNTEAYMKADDINTTIERPSTTSSEINDINPIKLEPLIEHNVDSTEAIMDTADTVEKKKCNRESPSIAITETKVESSNSPIPNLPSTHIQGKLSSSSSSSSSTAPRGIRMKFVTRRSDLNNLSPGIKVKSLSDLQGIQRKPNVTLPSPSPSSQYPPSTTPDQVQNQKPIQKREGPVNPLVISMMKNGTYGINFT